VAVNTKCIYDKQGRADGLRVLITRFWPRGIPKDRIDRWEKELGTPPDLIKKWKSGRIRWTTFSHLYLQSVREMKDKISDLAALARKRNITLFCTCRNGNRCHRKLLKKLIEKQAGYTK
jgi:uncharacterized protein YeaO (DUF488 family)